MAFPLALLGLGLSVAGAGASYLGAKRASEATSSVWEGFRQRNKSRQQEADTAFQSNLSKSGADTADKEIEAGADRRKAEYVGLARSASPAPLPQTNTLIKGTTGGKGKAVKNAGTAWSKLLANAQAKLGGRADWQQNQAIRDQRTSQELGRISNFARGDLSNVVPVELNAAARKGDSLKGWGSLLSTAGMLTGTAAALRSGPATVAQRASTMKANPALGQVFTGENSMWGSLIP